MNHKLSISNITLILANLVPLIGVLFLGWDGKGVFVIYILETVIIGILNVIKMTVVYLLNSNRNEPGAVPGQTVTGWGLIPFFIFHYYFFIFVQSVLFFAFSGVWGPSGGPEPFHIFAQFSPYVLGGTSLAIISLTIANVFDLIEDFILSGKYRETSMSTLMFQPYKRIFLQQFVVILGGFIFMLSGSAVAVAVLFILLKTGANYISFNYSTNPKIQEWVKKNTIEKEGANLPKEQKEMVERILKGK